MSTVSPVLLLVAVLAFGSRTLSAASLGDNGAATTTSSTSTGSRSLEPVITPAPSVHDKLQRRSPVTCAYVRGNSDLPLTCPEGYNCVNTIGLQAAWACCNDIECPGNWGVCNEYGQKGCSGYPVSADACSSIFGSILQCPQSRPHCYRYARSSLRGDGLTYYSWACGTDTEDVLALAKATNGDNSNNQDPAPTTDLPFAVPGVTLNTNLPTGSAAPAPPGGQGGTNSISNASPTDGSKKGGLSTTAIVLIAIFAGGVSIIALVVGGYCLCRRHRRRKQQVQNPPRPVNMPYTPTVTNGQGSIYSWNMGVPNGAPASTMSGPTVTSYPLSERLYGSGH